MACEPAFAAMSRSSWATLKQVSGPSPYTADLVSAVDQVVESVKPLIEQKKYLRNFLDKACRSEFLLFCVNLDANYEIISLILAKFTNSLVKSRPLREIGAEQVTPVYIFSNQYGSTNVHR